MVNLDLISQVLNLDSLLEFGYGHMGPEMQYIRDVGLNRSSCLPIV
ncbi:hypothetical protein SBF1_6290001 [Candidatus Desulfosporosinus infrequens]|uniref:Uncharacterized protein n=1 Tax=Candidatus Desulfosporosinus infrequens TaxID=2043169 RepID=A0A2U3LMB5_9FIRM|nr:hypothetical protein SBF1_6290001 [Candidatus Desulfosporosinus infrequens]